jgi:endonuclease YncB( thermonuclease family)
VGRWLVVAGLVLVAALGLGLSQADVTEGRVVRVVDGDTIVVEGQGIRQKVRLSAIDTPERDQPWGDSATREMRRLVAGKDVSVHWYKTDRWDRLIGNVLVDGEDAGLLMIERGMAWHFKRYADEQTPADRDAYSAAEKAAQAAKRGLWSDTQPIPPWEWRKR